jgi:hypothetical protein
MLYIAYKTHFRLAIPFAQQFPDLFQSSQGKIADHEFPVASAGTDIIDRSTGIHGCFGCVCKPLIGDGLLLQEILYPIYD